MLALSGRGGLAQSIPVEGLRCTLSMRSAQSSIGSAQATSAVSPASGPSIPNARETAVQARRPARPTRPVAALTADLGRGSWAKAGSTSSSDFNGAFMAPRPSGKA